MIDFKSLEAKLQNITKNIKVDELDAAATKAATQLKGAVSTNAGSDLNADIKGIKSITVTADFAELEKLAESLQATMKPIAEQLEADLAPIAREIEKQINTTPTPGLLKADAPGVSDKLNKTVSSTSNLSTLTGKTVSSTGFLKANVTSTSPEGIRETLLGIGENIKADELETAMKEVLTPEVQQELTAAGSTVFDVTKKGTDGIFESLKKGDLKTTLTKVNNTTASINKSAAFGKIQSIMEGIGQGISGPIKDAVPGIGEGTLKSLTTKVTDLDYSAAVAEAKRVNPNVNAGEVETKLKSIDATVAGQTVDPVSEITALEAPTVIGSNSNSWSDNPPASLFTQISSASELQSELMNSAINRTEIFIDWEKNDANNLTMADINRIWKLKYNQPIDYHYVILESGKLYRGRPLDQPSSTLNLDNNHSIRGIYVGLVFNRSNGYNSKQFSTLKALLKTGYQAFPLMQVFGLRDVTGSYGDGPGFDVEDKIYKWFERTNLYDPSVEDGKSPQQLISLTGSTYV